MTQFLPQNLLALFAPRDPVPFLPPPDKLPHEKKNRGYQGVGGFLENFEDPADTPPPTRVETREERLERRRRERAEQVAYKLEQEIAVWDPHNISTVTTDPFRTLFVARINYDTSESKLRREFEMYGPIKKIVLCHNTQNGKPRGYAFIEYEHERDMHSAYKHADGKKIDGRRVLVDVERARTVKGWLPRRLGGGLGGTRRGGPDVNLKHSGREDNERERERYRLEREREMAGGRGGDRGGERGGDRGGDRDRDRGVDRGGDRDRGMDRDRGADRDRGERRRSRSREREKRRRSRSRSRDRKRRRSRDRLRDPDIEEIEDRPPRERERERDKDKDKERDRERKRKRSKSRDKDREEKKEKDKDKDKDKDRDRERRREKRDRERERDKERRGRDFEESDVRIKEEPADDYPDYSAGYNYDGTAIKEEDEEKYRPEKDGTNGSYEGNYSENY